MKKGPPNKSDSNDHTKDNPVSNAATTHNYTILGDKL